jgi:hypothetical protein
MTSKSFLGLCLATVIAVGLAIFAVSSQPTYQSSDAAGELLFPTLVKDVNSLKSIVVRGKDGIYTIEWDGQNWRFRERDNYVADDKKVNELVLRLARMAKIEPKTREPEMYERLDLNAPDAKDSRAKQVTLLDKEGKTLADVIVGKRKFTLGSKEGGTYVRLPSDAQTWLATGELMPGDKARDWLKRDVSDIKDKDIKRVTVRQPDGERVVVFKDKPEDTTFKIQGIPAGREPSTDFVADEFGRILAILLLDDVDKASDISFPANKTIKAEFEGFGGFEVTADYAEIDGRHWIKLRGQAASSSTPVAEGATDWAKVMAELNTRTEGWVFEVPAYEMAPLKKRMADITKKIEPRS